MPLDAGVAEILDRHGRGAAAPASLDVVLNAPTAAARLQGLLDLIGDCMLPRSLVVSVAGQPLSLLMAASGRLHDVTWYAAGDREINAGDDSHNLLEHWAKSLSRLVSRGDVLDVRLRLDTETAPSETSGLEVSALRAQCGVTDIDTTPAPTQDARCPVSLRVSGGTVTAVEGDPRRLGGEQDLTDLAEGWGAVATVALPHIGALRGVMIGAGGAGAPVLALETDKKGYRLSLVDQAEAAQLWAGWIQGA